MEGCFNSLKNERVLHQDYATREEARQDLFDLHRGVLQLHAPLLRIRLLESGAALGSLAFGEKAGGLIVVLASVKHNRLNSKGLP